MIEGDMLRIRVPATTANLGPGFDSIGLALQQFLTIDFKKSSAWEVVALSDAMKQFPTDESHLICQVAIKVGQKYNVTVAPCKILLKSEIPLARGLGSSAAAIVAGIELANQVADLQLSTDEKLDLANEFEGHPDNVGPAIYGGLMVGTLKDGELATVISKDLQFEAVVVVPHEELLTTSSREVLPKEMPFADAVKAGAVGNVLVAALLTGDLELAGKMMQADLYHQPYRSKIVPLLKEVEDYALSQGAFGVALSGAGPTVICFCKLGKAASLKEKLTGEFPDNDVISLKIDNQGTFVSSC